MSKVDHHGISTEIENEPHIEGRRVTVRRIGALTRERRLIPEEIAERLDLSLEQVHTALAYYYDHYEEMQALDRKRKQNDDGTQRTFDPEVLGADRREDVWCDRNENS